MTMKRIVILLAAFAALLMAGCSELEGPVGQLQGSWRPVYAVGEHDDAVYHITYDGAVDENGLIVGKAIARENAAVQYDMTILFSGMTFYQENGEDLFLTFFLDPPAIQASEVKPLHYYIENGRIYYELTNGTFVNCDPDYLLSGSGKYNEGQDLALLDRNTIRIGGVTYKRMR